MILKMGSPDQWHQHHLGTRQKGKFSGPSPNLLNQNLGLEPSNLRFNWPFNLFWDRPRLRTFDPGSRAPGRGGEAVSQRWRQDNEAGWRGKQSAEL